MAAVVFALALTACDETDGASPARAVTLLPGGDADRGRVAIERVGCGICHDIPGTTGPQGRVGPPRAGFAGRPRIGGAIPNRPDLLEAFVRNAPALVPQTAMPPMPLDPAGARDVAAYLMTLR
jgi:mono/diheme cytochrome c family protein